MIPTNPFQPNSIPPSEKRFRRMVTGAIIFSIIAIIAILFIFTYTINKTSKRWVEEDARKERMQVAEEQPVPTPLRDPASTDQELRREYNSTSSYSQHELNLNLYKTIKRNTPDSSRSKNAIIRTLDEMRLISDNICIQLESLSYGFQDTLASLGNKADWKTTSSYFTKAGRDLALKRNLHQYRERMIRIVGNLFTIREENLRAVLPLDDLPTSAYVVGWDDTMFYASPRLTIQYLSALENGIRTFEGSALNQFPQTVTH